MKVTDLFGMLPQLRPFAPGHHWNFPFFKPTQGPTTGPGGSGRTGIPRGASSSDPLGVVQGPPPKS